MEGGSLNNDLEAIGAKPPGTIKNPQGRMIDQR